MSRTTSYFNLDNWLSDDDYAVTHTLGTDRVHYIRDVKSQQGTLKLFTSDGEFEVKGGGEETITPASVLVLPQSSIGVANIPVHGVEADLIYISADLKTVRTYSYVQTDARYISDKIGRASCRETVCPEGE